MALLPPFMLDAVVAIGVQPPTSDQPEWIGTGFFYFVHLHDNDDGTSQYFPALVTNRHVLADESTICIRANPDGVLAPREYHLDLLRGDGSSRWTGHPDPEIDVAVIALNYQQLLDDGMRVTHIKSNRSVATTAEMQAQGVAEGDGAFLLGYPMGLVGSHRAATIVRGGSIARIQDLYAGVEKSFLVDATVFPGNSGGPVVLRPEVISIQGTSPVTKALVVGVLHSYLAYSDAAVSRQTGEVRVVFTENSGLVGVHPMEHVNEAIAANPEYMAIVGDTSTSQISPGVAGVTEES